MRVHPAEWVLRLVWNRPSVMGADKVRTAMNAANMHGITGNRMAYGRLTVMAAAVAMLLGSTAITTSANATDPEAPIIGSPLPLRYATQFGYGEVLSASPQFAIQPMESDGPYGTVDYAFIRMSDGTIARRERMESAARPPQVVDGTEILVPHASGEAGSTATFKSAATGQVTSSVSLPVDSASPNLLWSDDAWVMTNAIGTDTGHNTVTFHRADGAVVKVPNDFPDRPRWIGGDSSAAFVTVGSQNYRLNPVTGDATLLEFGVPGISLMGVSSRRVVGTQLVPQGSGAYLTRVRYLNRSTLQADGGVDVQTQESPLLLPWGDGVAIAVTTSGSPFRQEIRPVDPATGAVGAPAVTDVVHFRSLGDGTAAMVVASGADAYIKVGPASGGSAREVFRLPRVKLVPEGLAMYDGVVAASFETVDGVWTSPVTSPAWRKAVVEPGFDPNDNWRRFAHSGGTTVVDTQVNHREGTTWRISWDGGDREVGSYGVQLERGGVYMSRIVNGGSGTQTENTRSGAVASSWSGQERRPVDGTWQWSGPDLQGNLTARDLTGAQPDRAVPVGTSCSTNSLVDVWGRWAWLDCAGEKVVDLSGALEPFEVPARIDGQLGNGFVMWATPFAPDPERAVLHVVDLATHEERLYGPARHAPIPPGLSFAVDTAPTQPAATYIDQLGRARSLDLSWISSAARVQTPDSEGDDATPPALVAQPVLAPRASVVAATDLDLAWTFEDPATTDGRPTSGLASFDVRKSLNDGVWTMPASWQGMSSPRVADSIPVNSKACYSARARDHAGNVSGWSSSVCEYVDGNTPSLESSTGSVRYLAALQGTLTMSASFVDDHSVVSHDIESRYAGPGQKLSEWKSAGSAVASAAFTSGTLKPGAEACVRMRGRDDVGNVSGWTAARCTTVPTDSSSMTGGTTIKSSLALGGTFRRLSSSGAKVSLGTQVGHEVLLSFICGPGRAKADVYAGGKLLGRVSLATTSARRCAKLLTVEAGFSGNVSVVQRGSGYVDVDAIAVGR